MKSIPLAPYACFPEESRGRLFQENPSLFRTCFQRDRDRIVHSEAFRRMMSKTQVFVLHEGKNYRTRLTHSLEVSQVARSVAKMLNLNEDLAEALALAHDLGHAPFGHAGETALNSCMADYGGFDHNAQSLKVITKLETQYPTFDGLNLTWETLEGLIKHNGPLAGRNVEKPLSPYIYQYNKTHNLELDTYPSLEAQVASISDDIAYNNHDMEDGLMAELFTLRELCDIPWIARRYAAVEREFADAEKGRKIHELIRRLVNEMLMDLMKTTQKNLELLKPKSVGGIRKHGEAIATFSKEMQKNDRTLKEFLFPHMYRHYKVMQMTSKGKRLINDLFKVFMEEPRLLPLEIQKRIEKPTDKHRAIAVCDYLSGMTDRALIEEHARLFDMAVI